jgi:hypothetical protein
VAAQEAVWLSCFALLLARALWWGERGWDPRLPSTKTHRFWVNLVWRSARKECEQVAQVWEAWVWQRSTLRASSDFGGKEERGGAEPCCGPSGLCLSAICAGGVV